jgi:hypothetical protein
MRSETEQQPAVVNAAIEPSENTQAPAPEDGAAETPVPADDETQKKDVKTPVVTQNYDESQSYEY